MAFLEYPGFKRAAMAAFWTAFVFAMVMGILPKPPETPIDRYGDKFAHIMAFATLAGLGALAFAPRLRWRVAERLSFAGALLEVIQSIPSLYRDCDIRDWIADSLAVFAVMAFASAYFAWREGKVSKPPPLR
jgi:VanZ family protein